MSTVVAQIDGVYLAETRDAAGNVTGSKYIATEGKIELNDGEDTGSVILGFPLPSPVTVTLTIDRQKGTARTDHNSDMDIYGLNCALSVTHSGRSKRKLGLDLLEKQKTGFQRNTYQDFHAKKAGFYKGSRK